MNQANVPSASPFHSPLASAGGFRAALRWLLLVVLAAVALTATVPAAVITARSVAQEDVAAAIASASDGDTVVIPAGTATYTTTVTIDKAITLQGAGIGQTILLDNVSGSTTSVFIVKTELGKFYRLTGIEIGRSRSTGVVTGAVRLTGTSQTVRIDHCKFNGPANEHITVYGTVYGVIDNCEFILQGSTRAVMFHNGSAVGTSFGDASWEEDVDWGGPKAIYVEDCRVINPSGTYGTIDGWEGGRIVFRYSHISNSRFSNHGTESSQRKRSARAMEIYGNVIESTERPANYINLRGGSAVIFGNTITGPSTTAISLNAYRAFTNFQPWGVADGTKAWDQNDLSDGSSTPGGAGDGVFASGIATGGSASELIDGTKNWRSDEWAGFVLRQIASYRGSNGGLRQVTVSSAGWSTDQWARWEITKVSTNEKSMVISNTSDTITLSTISAPIDFSGGGEFVLSRASEINSNTPSTLVIKSQGTFVDNYVFSAGNQYEIRRVTRILDQPGAGRTNRISGSPPPHQDLNQMPEPVYQWDNSLNGASFLIISGFGSIREGRDFFNNVPKPGYTPYTYPHPLRAISGGGGSDTTAKPPAAPSNARVSGT